MRGERLVRSFNELLRVGRADEMRFSLLLTLTWSSVSLGVTRQ